MSAATKFLALGATPQERAVVVVHELCAAAGGARGLDDEATHRACDISRAVLLAAVAGGMTMTENVLLLGMAARGQQPSLVAELAAGVVAHVGGPDKLFALIDLVTAPTDWNGFPK